MAQKRFSRLSVMLEARDRMSRPMQSAARASQNLQSRVTKLSGALNKSKSSVANASVANRILAEKYRELGMRIGATDQKLKSSSKIFRSLPAVVRLAAYSMEGYAKSLVNVISKNSLVRITTKLITSSFKTLYTVTWNLSYYLKRATKALWDFTRLGKVVNLLAMPFKAAANGAKKLALEMGKTIKKTFVYQLLEHAVKGVGKQLKLTAIAQKTFLKDIPALVKNTHQWQFLSSKIQNVKRQIGAARIAFELWKNSSKTVEKVTNSFRRLGDIAKKPLSVFKLLALNIKNMGNAFQKTGATGRTTFQQLVGANAKLNGEVSRLNAQLARANSRLGSMKSNLSSLNTIGLAFSAAYAGQAAYNTGEQVVQGTVGKAMEQQYSAESVGILAGAENGAKFYKQIQNYAASTAYSSEDWARNMRGAIMKSGNVKDLEKYQVAMEQLATLDPAQGLDGAALAIRELNSGDITSLVERFELPRSALKGIKDMEDPIEQIEALSKLVGDNTGYTVKNIQKMKELPLMQWQKMTNSIKTAFGYMGAGALEVLAPLMKKFNDMWDSGAFDGFIEKVKNGFTSIAVGITNFITKVSEGFASGSIQSKFEPFINLFNNMKNSIAEAWPTIQEIFSNAQGVLSQVATDINAAWPAINEVFQTTLDLVKDISSWINDNWTGISAVVVGLAAGISALKVASTVATAIGLLNKAVIAYKSGTLLATTATWLMNSGVIALNASLWANPIVWVVALIIALGAALYVAYQKSETFRNAVQAAWGWIRDVGLAIVNNFKSRVDDVASAFKSVAEWIGNAWSVAKDFFSDLINFKMPEFKFPKAPSWMSGSGGSGSKKEDGSHHGGLNRVPYDGYTAKLHKGERILTAQENKEYRKGEVSGVTVTGNTFIVRKDSDIDAVASALFAKLSEAKAVMG